METETFTVQNVRCQGCVSAIRDGLAQLPGVEAVEVSIDEGRVTVRGRNLDRAALAEKLGALGYPEAPAA